jgi:hypothetical protein
MSDSEKLPLTLLPFFGSNPVVAVVDQATLASQKSEGY